MTAAAIVRTPPDADLGDEAPESARAVVRDRLRLLAGALGEERAAYLSLTQLRDVLASQLDRPDPARVWLGLAVLRAEFPHVGQVDDAVRACRLDGAAKVVRGWMRDLLSVAHGDAMPHVKILDDAVMVDAFHTASVDFVTGIQRVVGETVQRWSANHELTAIGWTDGYRAFRRLRPIESRRLFGAAAQEATPAPSRTAEEVLIPRGGCLLIPELPVEPDRTRQLQSLAQYADTQVALIGHDLIPITSPDTVSVGMNANFARFLPVVRHADRVAVTSVASNAEFAGWRRMINSAGFAGPEIAEVGLPAIARDSDPADVIRATEELCLPGLPLVLVVGSHEPRKNHLAVLHAAELLWRSGHRFNLVLVGGGSWMSDRFFTRVDELRAAGRPVSAVSGLDDGLLWAAYRIARCVLFPSLNEGFGLPVAEALAAGTPVVTSDFGSMREILSSGGEPRGGLLVDPRDDRSIAGAIASMLADGPEFRRLKAEARAFRPRSWDQYATQSWAFLTKNRP